MSHSLNHAKPISFNSSGISRIHDSLNSKNRIDLFKFTITSRSNFRAALVGLKANADLALLRGKEIVAQSKNRRKKPEAINQTLFAGTYSLRISTQGHSTRYRLNLASTATTETIVFPTDAGILNVKTQFGAKGDGITDDTAAIQAALNAYANDRRIIYLPQGTYLVSNTLTWPSGKTEGESYKNTILEGESEQGVVIKLRDKAPGYTDPAKSKAVIYTGPAPAQRFGNSIRNLTIDTGLGNAGAIGAQFNANNQGVMRNVTIQSKDGLGVTGLDMSFSSEIGPLLIKDVTIKGYQYGIATDSSINSQTLENITLKDQTVYGIRNGGQVLSIHNLKSENAVSAIYSANGGLTTLVDATLTGKAGASTLAAIDTATARIVARNLTTAGYKTAIHAENGDVVAPTVSEFVSDPVQSLFSSTSRSLNLPIRDTPTVPWDDPKTWANVVSYGAIPNDGKDDTTAIQAAIDSGKSTVYFPATGTFEIQGTILVRNNVHRILGTEGKVRSLSDTASFKVVDGTSPTVVIERMANGFDFPLTLENASSRTLVLKDLSDMTGNMTGSGNVFIEDVVGGNWRFGKQNIWARQLNVENKGTHITNNGGNLWILGLKTEQGGTIINTINGGKTELLGGLIYNTNNASNGSQDQPMFIDSESSTSFTFAEINFGGGSEYTTYVQETKSGITKNLSGANLLSSNSPYGKIMPLYVGYP